MGLYDDSPCKECVKPKRYPGCHATCPERKEWADNLQANKDKIRAEKDKEDAVYDALKRTKKTRWKGKI